MVRTVIFNAQNSDLCSSSLCVPLFQKVGQGHFINLFSLVKKGPEILVLLCVTRQSSNMRRSRYLRSNHQFYTKRDPLGLYKKSAPPCQQKNGTGLRVSSVYLFVTKFQTRFLHEIRQIIGDKGTKVNNLFFLTKDMEFVDDR